MKNIFVYVISVVVLCTILLSFSACGNDKSEDNNVKTITNKSKSSTVTTNAEEEVETVIVYITDKKGNNILDSNGEKKTQISKVKNSNNASEKTSKADNKKKAKKSKASKTTFTYKIIDGDTNDPAVVDPF